MLLLLLFKWKSLVNDNTKPPVVVDELDMLKTEKMNATTSSIDESIINIFIIWPRPAVLLFVDVDVEFVKIILLFEEIKANDSDDRSGRRISRKQPSSSPLPQSLFFTVAMEEDEDHTINIDLIVSRGPGERNYINCP